MLVEPGRILAKTPSRVLVAGTSGAGKTTLAAAIGTSLNLVHVEIDALFHGPGWTPRPQFAAEVDAFSRQDRWVTEWQYGAVRQLLAERADLMVWLDLPRRQVMQQVITRTVQRRLHHQEMWNGNREPALWTVLRDRDHIVRWAWRTHPETRPRVLAVDETLPTLPIVRLRSHAQANRWLRSLPRPD
ncbi:MAG: AAA family ATPase [Acidobacteria bacterium]|nr:AAA family ATPase [Acidobacteriota bacterium]